MSEKANPAEATSAPTDANEGAKPSKKDLIRKFLKDGIEKGDPDAVAIIQEGKYIQHNPQTKDGGVGLAQLFSKISKTNPRVNIVRAFEDGDYVFAQTEYDFSTRRIGFEVFRFCPEGKYAAEHWDNIQPRAEPELNESGHSMIDGPTEASDHDLTETNRKLVREFVQTVFVESQWGKLSTYLPEEEEKFVQHSPRLKDGMSVLKKYLEATEDVTNDNNKREKQPCIRYQKIHRVLAEGDHVLVVSEGYREGNLHTSFYDLYRVENGKIVEHWETIETVPPKSEWKHNNGKFQGPSP